MRWLAFLILLCTPVCAQDLCRPRADVEREFAQQGLMAHWSDLTEGQFHFMQGLYVANPKTPPGLPRGTSAVLVEVEGIKGATGFFVEDDAVCSFAIFDEDTLKIFREVGKEEGTPL